MFYTSLYELSAKLGHSFIYYSGTTVAFYWLSFPSVSLSWVPLLPCTLLSVLSQYTQLLVKNACHFTCSSYIYADSVTAIRHTELHAILQVLTQVASSNAPYLYSHILFIQNDPLFLFLCVCVIQINSYFGNTCMFKFYWKICKGYIVV